MCSKASSMLFALGMCLPLSAQQTTPAVPDAPTVSFKSAQATPLDVIYEVGKQTHVPIGIVFGRDPQALSRTKRAFDLRAEDPETALLDALRGTGYVLDQRDGVLVLQAGDLTDHQFTILRSPLQGAFGQPGSMQALGIYLTERIQAAEHASVGYAASILGSLSDERLDLKTSPGATPEEIADAIVSLGSRGLWLLRVAPEPSDDPSADEIEIRSYHDDRAFNPSGR